MAVSPSRVAQRVWSGPPATSGSSSTTAGAGPAHSPPGAQAVTDTTPPGRTARSSCAATAGESSANITPKAEVTTSRSRYDDRSVNEPWCQSTAAPAASARLAASASIDGVRSTPWTNAPRRAASMATVPVPQATSSTRTPSRSRPSRQER